MLVFGLSLWLQGIIITNRLYSIEDSSYVCVGWPVTLLVEEFASEVTDCMARCIVKKAKRD